MISAKKSHQKRIWIIIITTVFLFCIVSLAVTKVVYDAVFDRYDQPADIPKALDAMVAQRSVYRFSSGENQLTGYYYGTDGPANGLIVLVPGFHAGGDDYLWQISELGQYGWAVFTFDATGTLQSQGKTQVGFSQLVLDLEAALEHIENNRHFGYNEVVLVGHSRGAYAACCALRDRQDVAAVVAISGVNSAMEAVMQSSVEKAGPISYGNYGFLWLYQAMLFGQDLLGRNAAEEISESYIPVLVIHGTQDEMIPADTSAIIAHREKIHSPEVEYLLCPAGHTDLLYDEDGTANDALIKSIHEFLIRSLKEERENKNGCSIDTGI